MRAINILQQRFFFEDPSKKVFFWFCATLLFFVFLDKHFLWTMENTWSSICNNMLLSGDYWHPYYDKTPYYDKPLLSYWIIIAFSKLIGFSKFSLRLPSALAGLLTLYLSKKISEHFFNPRTAMLTGWLFLSTFYFIFWSRTAGVEMINVAGILLSFYWYILHRDNNTFISYFVFFLIGAITSLFKGLLGIVLPLLMISFDLFHENRWKQHLNFKIVLAFLLASLVYALPFALSAFFNDGHYQENGFAQVFSENILRFIKPFDHKNPIYTYLIYLPIYLLPWIFFYVIAQYQIVHQWKVQSYAVRWLSFSVGLLFLFFTASGSRRSYYILPLQPLALMLTADFLVKYGKAWVSYVVAFFLGINFVFFACVMPFLH